MCGGVVLLHQAKLFLQRVDVSGAKQVEQLGSTEGEDRDYTDVDDGDDAGVGGYENDLRLMWSGGGVGV